MGLNPIIAMKLLFIHGLASSGRYKMASSLRILLKGWEVISPDVPIEPQKALHLLRSICESEKVDLVVGLSLGGFWAQKLRGYRKILVNPDFHVSALLESMKGEVKYLSPREDGSESFIIDDDICRGYRELEKSQFDSLDSREIELTRALFALDDELVRCGAEFESHYPNRGTEYPGKHLPVFPELKKYLVPVVKELVGNGE